MIAGDWIAILGWLLLAIVFVAESKRRNQPNYAIAAAMIFLAPLAMVSMWWVVNDSSVVTIVIFYVGLVLIGAVIIVFLVPESEPYRRGNKLAAYAFEGLFGIALVFWGGWVLIADHLFQHQLVQDSVNDLTVVPSGRAPSRYVVKIGNQRLKISNDLFNTLHAGDFVKAEVGRGSGYVLRIERSTPPPAQPIKHSMPLPVELIEQMHINSLFNANDTTNKVWRIP